MQRRVFITGGTGLIGKAIVGALLGRGDRVVVLSRNAQRGRDELAELGSNQNLAIIEGDPTLAGPWQEQLAGAHAVINLAGATIGGKRWSAHYKQILHDSRVESTRYLVEGITALPPAERPAVLVSASGADYYPFAVDMGAALAVDEDDEVTEQAPPGSTFLARLCRNWESEAGRAAALGVRVVCMRTGIVLGPDGALERMALPFRWFVGGRIGNGRQWMSWIHLDDAARAYLYVIDNDSLSGPVNLVAPQTVRAADFARQLGRALGRPAWLPVPGFALRLAVGELAEYMLNGRRVVPAALLAHGFTFEHPELADALSAALKR